MDNAATTSLDVDVKAVMIEEMKNFGNPSSMYKEGREVKKKIENARGVIANILNCKLNEVFFTSSGTESDNLAIFGTVFANQKKGKHIITTKIEHHAVLYPFEKLEKEGFEVTYLDVDEKGYVDVEQLKKVLRKDTIFVSVMYVNNEIGTIQPIKEISNLVKKKSKEFGSKIIFHTDAAQAVNYCDIDVQNLGVDLMSFSASKIYGPKGIGVLYKKSEVVIEPQILGGGQENNLRSGTESLILISGLTEALKKTQEVKKNEVERLKKLQKIFVEKILSSIKNVYINGGFENRIPNNIHISVTQVEGEALLLMLDECGISCGTGSACSSADLDTSHVLQAIKIPIEHAHGSLRFTMGRLTRLEDINFTVGVLKEVVERLRSFSSIRG